LRCDIPADWLSNFSQCLYDWQSLEAAGLALLAAGASVWFVQRQIRQVQAHRADDISRRHNAARLTLPLALAAISELVQRIANKVGDEFESFGPDGARTIKAILDDDDDDDAWNRFESLSLPNEVLASLENFVASLNREQDVRHVAELVASIQILLSRYNGFDLKKAGAQHNLAGLLLDAAKVKLLNEKIYNYARFVDDTSFGIVAVITIPAAWDEIHGKAQGLVFHRQSPDAFFPSFKEQIDSYKEHNVSPWNEKFGD
jgi:hypothetical protein